LRPDAAFLTSARSVPQRKRCEHCALSAIGAHSTMTSNQKRVSRRRHRREKIPQFKMADVIDEFGENFLTTDRHCHDCRA
jgi:hypothetical protein